MFATHEKSLYGYNEEEEYQTTYNNILINFVYSLFKIRQMISLTL